MKAEYKCPKHSCNMYYPQHPTSEPDAICHVCEDYQIKKWATREILANDPEVTKDAVALAKYCQMLEKENKELRELNKKARQRIHQLCQLDEEKLLEALKRVRNWIEQHSHEAWFPAELYGEIRGIIQEERKND